MNTQPKNKILVLMIGILLVANIATLSYLFLSRNDGGRPSRTDRKAQVTAFLKNEVGFTKDQLDQYDTLSKDHRSKMKQLMNDMSGGREAIFKQLAVEQFSDSAMDSAADAIAQQQKTFEVKMLQHLKDMRNICTAAQRATFDTGFYKIIARRGDKGETKKDNRKQ